MQATAVVGDLLDARSLLEACDGIDTILHLAGEAHVGSITEDPSTHPIVMGAQNLLAAALQQKVRRIVFLSSSLAEAAENDAGDVTNYGRSKLAAETVFSAACERGEVELVILRPVNVYGIGMKGNIAGMISLIHCGRLPPLPAISSRISLIGVRDLARAILLAVDSPTANGRVYTITDGEAYVISEIEAAIYRALGKTRPTWGIPAVILYVASAVAGILNRIGLRQNSISTRTYRNLMIDNLFSNEAAARELGFIPQITLYEQLPEIIENFVNKGSKS